MIQVPTYEKGVGEALITAGYQAYVVGGCVRDAVIGREFHDVDLATNATPDQVEQLFETLRGFRTVPTGKAHGTITVTMPLHDMGSSAPRQWHATEVTTFRKDVSTDGRRATVAWADTIEEDLSRRDFTMNALAWDLEGNKLIDPFDGTKDIAEKKVVCVGDSVLRFQEDHLRILRAVRFVAQLGFDLHPRVVDGIQESREGLQRVSWERKRDELLKLLKGAPEGLERALLMATDLGLIEFWMPYMVPSIGCVQNSFHTDDVWMHSVLAAKAMRKRTEDPVLVLAALFHDIAKPKTKGTTFNCSRCGLRRPENKDGCVRCGAGQVRKDTTFHAHDSVGEALAAKQCRQLKMSKKGVRRVANLVRYHLFRIDSETWSSKCGACGKMWRSHYSRLATSRPSFLPEKDKCPACEETKQVEVKKICSESSLGTIRRLVRNVGGEEAFEELLLLREADREGNRKKRGKTFHHILAQKMMAELKKENAAFTLKDMVFNGGHLIEMGLKPGPRFKEILNGLFEKVMDDPELNELGTLKQLAKEAIDV